MIGAVVSALNNAVSNMHSAGDVAVLVLYVSAALAITGIALAIFRDFSDPLRKVPGPFLARYTRFWLFAAYKSGKIDHICRDVHNKYGPIVRIAPGQYSFNTSEAARKIYSHGGKLTKSDWYTPFGRPEIKGLFNVQDNHVHSEIRRKLANVFSLSALKDYEPYVDQCVGLYTQRLKELATSGKAFDLHHYNQCFAFDLIGLITWSRRFGFLDAGKDINGFMRALEEDFWWGTLMGNFPELVKYLRPIMIKLNLPGGRGANTFQLFTKNTLEEKKTEPTEPEPGKPMDFVQKLLYEREHKGKTDLADTDILLAASANMTAGSDTVGASLSAIFYYLITNPRCLKVLQDELDTAEKEGRLSQFITHEQAAKLPYLQAVIKEAMRLLPAGSIPLPRKVPDQGLEINDTFFPAGTIVSVNPVTLHFNEQVYGPDCGIFRPERWLERNEHGERNLHEADHLGFGQGNRMCIGKNIALLEMSKLVPALMRDFEFELSLPGGASEWVVEAYIIARPQNFEVVARERKREGMGV